MRVLSDDMFYYLSVARHFAREGSASFDGLTASNGFHPLWMLILSGFVRLASDALELPIHLALMAIALCLIAQGLLLQRILAHYDHGTLGALVSIGWLLNPAVVGDMALGMETALYGACVLGTLYAYLRCRESPSPIQAAGMGTLLGLTALARLDAAILVLVLGLDVTWRAIQRRRWMVPLAMALPVVALLAPWVIWSLATVGTPLPTSGRALDLWAFGVQDAIGRGRWSAAASGLARNLLQWTDQHLRLLTGMPELEGTPVPLLGVLLGLSLGLALWMGVTVLAHARYAAFRPLLLAGAIHTGYYLLRAPQLRYLLPSILIEVVVVAVLVGDRLRRLRGAWTRPARRVALAGVAAWFLAWAGLLGWEWHRGMLSTAAAPLHVTMYTAGVPWLQEHTPPGAMIGSFNAGIFGYFSGRQVVNLDGVINEAAYRALATHRLADYIDQTGLEWVIDWGGQLEWFLARFNDRSRVSLHFVPVATFEQTWRRGRGELVIYRVTR
jgi:hypothetical protein